MNNTPMIGTLAANPHEGSRSEILADYLFSGWGTVTPVRRQDDYGIDLYCTLTERVGQRALVSDYFVVQIKSIIEPWVFEGEHSVRWLVEYPSPLFLACVDKKAGILRVYHVMPRFLVSLGRLPARLELIPSNLDNGEFIEWQDGQKFSLSAPILRVTLADLLNGDLLRELREVFTYWVRSDRNNCDLFRRGLLRFRMPVAYAVNQMPSSIGEMGNAVPEVEQLTRGILAAAEAVECIGGQLGRRGDRAGALWAALVVDHLQKSYPNAFTDQVRWQDGLPADLGQIVYGGLNKVLMSEDQVPSNRYRSFEAVQKAIMENPLFARYVADKAAAQESDEANGGPLRVPSPTVTQ